MQGVEQYAFELGVSVQKELQYSGLHAPIETDFPRAGQARYGTVKTEFSIVAYTPPLN